MWRRRTTDWCRACGLPSGDRCGSSLAGRAQLRHGSSVTVGPSSNGEGMWPAVVDAVAQVFVEDVSEPDLSPEDAHHVGRVLRLRAGEVVIAADGRGAWRPCLFVATPSPTLEPMGDVVSCAAPEPAVTVAFVPVKGERPEWVVQKLTEIGVDRVVVVRSARSVVRWDRDRDHEKRALDRLRRVAAAAAAQSRRPWLPTVEGIVDLGALAALVAPLPVALAHRGGSAPDLSRPTIAVGPEGGWTDVELDQVSPDAVVGLGPTVLRAETAALAVATLLCALREGAVAPVDGSAG